MCRKAVQVQVLFRATLIIRVGLNREYPPSKTLQDAAHADSVGPRGHWRGRGYAQIHPIAAVGHMTNKEALTNND